MSACVEWNGARDAGGYGRGPHGKLAHRLAWEQVNGRLLQPGEVVLHTCDNPPCVKPEHLRVGSQKDNVRDMYAKGRNNNNRAYGEAAPAKLTASQALAIRDDPRTAPVIAAEYGVGATAIRQIKNGVTWVRAIRELQEGFHAS